MYSKNCSNCVDLKSSCNVKTTTQFSFLTFWNTVWQKNFVIPNYSNRKCSGMCANHYLIIITLSLNVNLYLFMTQKYRSTWKHMRETNCNPIIFCSISQVVSQYTVFTFNKKSIGGILILLLLNSDYTCNSCKQFKSLKFHFLSSTTLIIKADFKWTNLLFS